MVWSLLTQKVFVVRADVDCGDVAALTVTAFVVYLKVQTSLKVNSEIQYINNVQAQIKSVFVNGNYAKVTQYWTQAKARNEEWTVSPNGLLGMSTDTTPPPVRHAQARLAKQFPCSITTATAR